MATIDPSLHDTRALRELLAVCARLAGSQQALARSRCSTWLAQIDHALGSECDRTQAASPEGDEAQAWRLGTIAALRPTNHESEDL